MIPLRIEVGSGRLTKRESGYMHQITFKNDEGYQSIQQFNSKDNKPIEQGIYDVNCEVRVSKDNDGYQIYQLVPDLRSLQPVKATK